MTARLMRMWLMAFAMAATTAAQNPHDHRSALDERGKKVMGFDQTTTTHHFILTKDGGRIEVTANDPADSSSISQIRSHLQHIAVMFTNGNFEAPMLVHAMQPPGIDGMKKAGSAIAYRFEQVDRGGWVRITVASPAALSSVHEFLRFQIQDHRTGDPLVVK